MGSPLVTLRIMFPPCPLPPSLYPSVPATTMAACFSPGTHIQLGGSLPLISPPLKLDATRKFNLRWCNGRRPSKLQSTRCSAYLEGAFALYSSSKAASSASSIPGKLFDLRDTVVDFDNGMLNCSDLTADTIQRLVIADIDPATAKLAIGILGPFLSAFGFLFILRIVMSWYPKLPVGKFPYVIAYAPTEPLLVATRKLIPPLGGVDVTPVVWFGLISFLNEILVGPQGLLILLSQQVS